jgi:hypothetical protein
MPTSSMPIRSGAPSRNVGTELEENSNSQVV